MVVETTCVKDVANGSECASECACSMLLEWRGAASRDVADGAAAQKSSSPNKRAKLRLEGVANVDDAEGR